MNKLQLVQRFNQEVAATGETISTTINQTGMIKRLVDWIDSAYQDIQDLHEDWDFLRADFSFPTVSGTREYAKADISLDELNAWEVDDIRIYTVTSDETNLEYTAWDDFKYQFLFGPHRVNTGRPFFFSIDPVGSFWTGLIPNAVFTINGEYFKRAQVMSLDADIPLIPTQSQMAIVWRALMFYGAFEGADEVYSHGEKEFARVLSQLEFREVPRQTFLKGPLA